MQLSGGMPYASKGLEEDDVESPAETCKDRHRMCEAPRCPSFNHTTSKAAPMSHNLTSASAVDPGGRDLRKRQVDVGNNHI
jgi:hypothetical protein